MTASTMETEDLVKLALGGRARRNTRIRRALIARLLNEQGEEGEEDGDGGMEEMGDDERQLAELLLGRRMIRRRRLRRMLLAHLLSERGDSDEAEFDEEGMETDEETPDLEREVARLLLGRKVVRRRRGRRALLARYLRDSGTFD